MSAINELKEGVYQIETAQFVTTMLRDISATKLQALRARFEANERYFDELHQLTALVETYRQEQGLATTEKKTRKQKIIVAVTSNKRFYGMLNQEIILKLESFLLEDASADCLVVGQTGRQILETRGSKRTIRFSAFQKDEPTASELLALVSTLGAYDEVIVIHPSFISAFQQHASATDLTHIHTPKKVKTARTVDYVFEPEIAKILAFFKTQIRLVLFERAMLETELAFTGARLMKMQRARERAGELLTQERRRIHKEMNTVKSMRLLETFAGFHGTKTL